MKIDSTKRNTHTTMTVITNPANRKNMPAWLNHGIARLKKQTSRHAIHVAMT